VQLTGTLSVRFDNTASHSVRVSQLSLIINMSTSQRRSHGGSSSSSKSAGSLFTVGHLLCVAVCLVVVCVQPAPAQIKQTTPPGK